MLTNNGLDLALPTPFGWLLTTEADYGMNRQFEFTSQLLALARSSAAFGNTHSPETAPAESAELVPVTVSMRKS